MVNEEGSKDKSSKIEFHNTPSEKPGEKDPYAPQNPKHSKTGYKDQKKTNENVQTGDPMEYLVWAVVLVLCASVLGFTFRKKKC